MVSVDDVSFPVLGIGWSAFYYGDSEMFKNVRNIIILFGVNPWVPMLFTAVIT